MNIDKNNYEEWLLRKIDNDLNASEARALDKFLLANPDYRAELEAFEKTVLVSEPVVFKNKSSLYREVADVKVLPLWYQRPMYWAAAASIALVVGLSVWLMNNDGKQPDNNVANNNNSQVTQPVIDSTIVPKPEIKSFENKSLEKPVVVESYAATENVKGSKPIAKKHSGKVNHLPKESFGQGVLKPEEYKRENNPVDNPDNNLENNLATAVTNRDDGALQLLETYPMIQFHVTNTHQAVEPRDVSFIAANFRAESTAARLVTNALKMSGNDSWAKAFERYSRIADRKIEVTFNSDKLNLHKTLFNNN